MVVNNLAKIVARVKFGSRYVVFRKTTSGRMFSVNWNLLDICAEIHKHVDSSS